MMNIHELRPVLDLLIGKVLEKPIENNVPLYEYLDSIAMIDLLTCISSELDVDLEGCGGPTLEDLQNVDQFSRFVRKCMLEGAQ